MMRDTGLRNQLPTFSRLLMYWKYLLLTLYITVFTVVLLGTMWVFRFPVIALIFPLTLFIFYMSLKTDDLHRPVEPLFFPVLVAIGALMMTALLLAMWFVFGSDLDSFPWPLLIFGWIGWGLFFYLRYQRTERFLVLKGMFFTTLIGSSVALLLALIASNNIKNPQEMFAGFDVAIGGCLGTDILLWSCGLGIVLLFNSEKWKQEFRSMKDKTAELLPLEHDQTKAIGDSI